MSKLLEAGMMICFGVAWPVNLLNSIRTRSTKGKNIIFMYFIALAYILGIVNKLLYARDAVVFFYLFNFMMVLADIILYHRNKREENGTCKTQKNSVC